MACENPAVNNGTAEVGVSGDSTTSDRASLWHRPMRSRHTGEEHRVATPLELLFDLCFVVAVAQAAAALHHSIIENHIGSGVLSFGMAFFAIWWGWLNFAWFASAFDTDDVPYRLATFVQIAGALVVAAGVDGAFEKDFVLIIVGYALMRLAMVGQWLRAAASEPECRQTALRYAAGITLTQIAWASWLAVPESLALPVFLVLVVAELAVPVIAERAGGTSFHRHHIAERYSLFTIIVLGEVILGSTNAIKEGVDAGGEIGTLLSLSVAGIVIVFSLWWLYFDQPGHVRLTSLRASLVWGYGHYFIFAAVAAVGAGMEVAVDYDLHEAHIAALGTAMSITIPLAVFLLGVWGLQIGPRNDNRALVIGFPVAAVLVLVASFLPAPVHVSAGVLAVLVAVTVASKKRVPQPAH